MTLRVYFDGRADAKGRGSFGWIVRYGQHPLGHGCGPIEPAPVSALQAEYMALIVALEWLADNGYEGERLRVHGDSKQVILHMRHADDISSPTLQPLFRRARELVSRFDVKFVMLYSRQNVSAHALARVGGIHWMAGETLAIESRCLPIA